MIHSDLSKLTVEYQRTGRLRIEGEWGEAWLVQDYRKARDIKTGGVYSEAKWPEFLKLEPKNQAQVHVFLCELGGGRFDGVKQGEA